MNRLAYIVSAIILVAATTSAATTEPTAALSGTLDFETPSEAAARDIFFGLESNAGKVVRLSLRVVPAQVSGELGYELKKVGPAGENDPIVCGRDGFLGLVENYGDDYELTFGDPGNVHAKVTVHVGDRKDFPFQEVSCGVEGYTSMDFTPLYISGDFVVAVSEIPTQSRYDLFPYRR